MDFLKWIYKDWLAIIVILIIFLGLGGVLFIEAFFSKVYYNNNEIIKESLWTKKHSINWENVLNISHSNLLGWYAIESKQGNKIRVSDMMNGLESFLEQLHFKRPEFFNEDERL